MSSAAANPAEASAPDPNRASPDSPELMPEWFAYLIALLILFVIRQLRAILPRRRRPSAARPNLPQLYAERGRTPPSRQPHDPTGLPELPDCPELARAIAALRARLRQQNTDQSKELLDLISETAAEDDTAPTPPAAWFPTPTHDRTARPRQQAPRIYACPGTGPPPRPRAISA